MSDQNLSPDEYKRLYRERTVLIFNTLIERKFGTDRGVQTAVAQVLGVTQSYVSSLMRGAATPSKKYIKTLEALPDISETRQDDLPEPSDYLRISNIGYYASFEIPFKEFDLLEKMLPLFDIKVTQLNKPWITCDLMSELITHYYETKGKEALDNFSVREREQETTDENPLA